MLFPLRRRVVSLLKLLTGFWSQKVLAHHRAKRVLGALILGILLAGNLWLVLHSSASGSSDSHAPTAQGHHEAAEPDPIASNHRPGSAAGGGGTDFAVRIPVSEAEYVPDHRDQRRAKPRTVPSRPSTVKDAAARSCSTSSVEGLSKQIIAQSRCINPDAFVGVPDRPNLTKKPGVFLYLTAPARRHLLAALDAVPDRTLIVNSALRTLAQQYLLSRWGRDHRCGVQLAASPGTSNHESGLALDISHPEEFRSILEAHGFRWLGKKDRVHFDYAGAGAVAHNAVDVLAFQQLWNRNHPEDPIFANGRYTAQTERRLVKSPAAGFSKGAHCG